MTAAANTLFVWGPELVLRLAEVDAQHRNVFRLGGELELQVAAAAEPAAVAPLVTELVASVRNHFESEEELMRTRGAEGYEAHRAEHQEFPGTIGAFASEFSAGQAKVTPALLQLVQDWLLKHIAGADRTMVNELSSAAVAGAKPRPN